MSSVTEATTGLEFFELSHPWEHNQPVLPGFDEPIMHKTVTHAKHGVLSQMFKTVFHMSTHINAPIHLVKSGWTIFGAVVWFCRCQKKSGRS